VRPQRGGGVPPAPRPGPGRAGAGLGRRHERVRRFTMTTVTPSAAGSFIGLPVQRVEDPTLLTGHGTYIANLDVPGMHGVGSVRSPVSHARIVSVDTSAALAMPGVVAVRSAADLDVPDYYLFQNLREDAPRPSLAKERVRFVGEIIAVVAAETKAQA